MKHILAALDLTAHADRAFERASMLAAAHGAKLTLVHIVDSNVLRYEDEGGALAEAMKAKAEVRLAGYTDRLDPESQSTVDSHVVIGKAWEEIIAVADRVESDLIVIGLHHVKPIKDAFRGTTAERVIRSCSRPILMVRDKPGGPYRKVVAATDFSLCSAHALEAGLRIAPDAAFTLLHVFETPFPALIRFSEAEVDQYKRPLIERARQEAAEAMDAFRRGHDAFEASITPMLERDEAVHGISKAVQDQKADLLVMGTRGRTGLVRAMVGSVALTFLQNPPCDVLVAH